MTSIGNNNTTGAATTAISTSTTKKQVRVDDRSPPSKAKSDPSSTASTVNKVTKPDAGKIEFGSKLYAVALIKEVSSLRANPKNYAKVLSEHVKSNPMKFKLQDSRFMESLGDALKTLKRKGKDLEAGKLTLPLLSYNSVRSAIASQGMELLANSGLQLTARQGGDSGVDTSNSNFLDGFIDHDLIEHLRKGGEGADGEVIAGSDNALNALKEKAGGQAMFHATDLENLHVSTGDSVTARDVIVGWLIDHGVETRGHRDALLNAGITEIGVGTSTATLMDTTGREVNVKITGMNFFGVHDFSAGKLMDNPPVR